MGFINQLITGGHLILWVDDQYLPGTYEMVSGCRIKTSGGRPTHTLSYSNMDELKAEKLDLMEK